MTSTVLTVPYIYTSFGGKNLEVFFTHINCHNDRIIKSAKNYVASRRLCYIIQIQSSFLFQIPKLCSFSTTSITNYHLSISLASAAQTKEKQSPYGTYVYNKGNTYSNVLSWVLHVPWKLCFSNCCFTGSFCIPQQSLKTLCW